MGELAQVLAGGQKTVQAARDLHIHNRKGNRQRSQGESGIRSPILHQKGGQGREPE